MDQAPNFSNSSVSTDMLKALVDLSQATDLSRNFSSLLLDVLEAILNYAGVDSGTIYLLAEDNYTLHRGAQLIKNDELDVPTTPSYTWGRGIPGRTLAEGRAIYLQTPVDLDEWREVEPSLASYKARICLPLVAVGQILGVLDLQHSQPCSITTTQRDGLETLTRHAAALILASKNASQAQATTTQLIVFYVFSSRILGTTTIQKALDLTTRFILEATPAHSAIIYLLDANENPIYSYGRERAGGLIQNELTPSVQETAQRIWKSSRPTAVSGYEPNAAEIIPASLRGKGIAAYVGLPMRCSNAALHGALFVRYTAPHVFSSMELEGLRLFADQVSGIVDHLQIVEQSRQRQAELESVIDTAHILTSTFNIDDLLQQIAIRLTWVTNVNACAISAYEPETRRMRVLAHYTSVGEPVEPAQEPMYHLDEYPATAEVLSSGGSLIVQLDDPQADAAEIAFLRQHGYTSAMIQPLVAIGKPIGLLELYSKQPHYQFSETVLRRVLLLSEQVALALINARIFQSEKEQRKLAEVLREIGLALSSSLKSSAILDILLDQIKSVIPYDSASVLLIEGDSAHAGCMRGYDRYGVEQEISRLRFTIKDIPILRILATTGRSAFISDVSNDPNWTSLMGFEYIGSWVGTPLIARDRLLGFLNLEKEEHSFYTSEHAKYLEILAAHASLAMLNAFTFGEVERASITDFLTGAFNHRHFHQKLRQEIERAKRIRYPLSLLMIDLDHFKQVNDSYGHPIGDQILQLLAMRLKNELRGDDLLARYGGEEFAIILPGAPEDALYQVASRLLEVVSDFPFQVEGHTIPITISIGGASFPKHASEAQELVGLADQALYCSKQSGRNCFHVCNK